MPTINPISFTLEVPSNYKPSKKFYTSSNVPYKPKIFTSKVLNKMLISYINFNISFGKE